MTRPAIVSPEELMLFRADPQREKTLPILDYVICRKCGAKLCMIFKRHLLDDGYASGADYQQEWKDAPIYSLWDEAKKHNWYFDHKAEVIADATQWNKIHPKRHNKATRKYRRMHHEQELARSRKWHEDNRKKIAEAERILARVLVMKSPRKSPHRPRKDEEAAQVAKLKTDGLSWKQIAIKLNHGKKKAEQKKPDAYRSLWRNRHPHGEKQLSLLTTSG